MATKKAITSTEKSHNTEKTTVKVTAAATRNQFLKTCKKIRKSLKQTPIFSVMLAEFIGTMILTIAFIQMQSYPVYFGYAVVGIALIIGGVSNAHLNPAMSIAAWVTRKISAVYALGYIAAQVLGATSGWLIIKNFLEAAKPEAATTATAIYQASAIPAGKEWAIFFAELVGAMIIGLGIAAAIKLRKNRIAASFAAGMAVLAAFYTVMVITSPLLTASGTTLTFLNPAIAGVLNAFVLTKEAWATTLGVYVIAPVLGGIIGFALYELMQDTSTDSSDEVCVCENC